MKHADHDQDARRVFDTLRWFVRELRRGQEQTGELAGLSVAQIFVIHTLKTHGPLSLGDLADLTATDPSSVSVVVRKLHEKKLVSKKPSPADRRRMDVALTDAGSRAADLAPVPVQEVLMTRLGRMRPEDRRTLADLLEQVAPQDPSAGPEPMFYQEKE